MIQIGIIGSAGIEEYPNKKPTQDIFNLARETGKLVAQNKAVLVTGGKGGIMQTASEGAKSVGGITVGVVKGNKRGTANKFIDIEFVANTAGGGEEALLISSCDGLIIIGGGAGTLQELAYAYRTKKPIVAIPTKSGIGKIYAGKYLDERRIVKVYKRKNPIEAVNSLMKLIKNAN